VQLLTQLRREHARPVNAFTLERVQTEQSNPVRFLKFLPRGHVESAARTDGEQILIEVEIVMLFIVMVLVMLARMSTLLCRLLGCAF